MHQSMRYITCFILQPHFSSFNVTKISLMREGGILRENPLTATLHNYPHLSRVLWVTGRLYKTDFWIKKIRHKSTIRETQQKIHIYTCRRDSSIILFCAPPWRNHSEITFHSQIALSYFPHFPKVARILYRSLSIHRALIHALHLEWNKGEKSIEYTILLTY